MESSKKEKKEKKRKTRNKNNCTFLALKFDHSPGLLYSLRKLVLRVSKIRNRVQKRSEGEKNSKEALVTILRVSHVLHWSSVGLSAHLERRKKKRRKKEEKRRKKKAQRENEQSTKQSKHKSKTSILL
jgi:hypothetical protein